MERFRLSSLIKDVEMGGDIDVVIAADAQAQIEAVQQSRTCAETYLPLIAALLTVQSTHTTLTSGWCEDVCNAVKTLQQERDEYARMWRDGCNDRGAAHKEIEELTAALDAEREKVKGLHEITKVICTHCCEPMEIPSKAVLQAQLSQLQALVRALVGTKSFTINGPDIRTMSGNVLYACSSQTSAERLGALLEYRERTLDATTPAVGGVND